MLVSEMGLNSPQDFQDITEYLQLSLSTDWNVLSDVHLPKDYDLPPAHIVIVGDYGVHLLRIITDHDLNSQSGLEEAITTSITMASLQALALKGLISQPASSRFIFDDPRTALSLPVSPWVLNRQFEREHENDSIVVSISGFLGAIIINEQKCSGTLLTDHQRKMLTELITNEFFSSMKTTSALTSQTVDQPTAQGSSVNEFTHLESEGLPHEATFNPHVTSHRPAFQFALRSWLTRWADQVVTVFDRIEAGAKIVERGLTEGNASSNRIKLSFLAHELETHLERTLFHSLRETIAHNHFRVNLASEDFDFLCPFKDTSESQLSEHLQHVITARDYRLLGRLQIELVMSSSAVAGKVSVESQIQSDSHSNRLHAYLVTEPAGECHILKGDMITIGRHVDCDISINAAHNQKSVSRWQAYIRKEGDHYVLYDGNQERASTGGTFVEGKALQWGSGQLLRDGDRIILGQIQRQDPLQPLPGSAKLKFYHGSSDMRALNTNKH